MLEYVGLALEGEGDAAGMEQGSGMLVPCAILMVAHQGESPAGKLRPVFCGG